MTNRERQLEHALLEYVVKYGLTEKAREVLTRLPNRRDSLAMPETEAISAER